MRMYMTITLSTALEKLIESIQGVHKHRGFWSFKTCTADAYNDALKKVNFLS